MRPFKEQLLNPSDVSFNVFEVPGSFEPYWHYHPELELTYVRKGSGTRCVGDHVGHFTNGDLVLLGKNVPHQWVCQKDGAEKDPFLTVIHFQKEIFEAFPESSLLKSLFNEAKRGIYFSNPSNKLLKKIMSLSKHQGLKSILAMIEIIDILNHSEPRFLLASDKFMNSGFFSNISGRLQMAHAYISQNYNNNIRQDDIAAHCNMSTTSFSRWFKKSTGSRFVDYVNKMRVSHSEQLLYMTNRPIKEIAHQSGFESSSAFNRSFKQIKGVSPKAFRNATNV